MPNDLLLKVGAKTPNGLAQPLNLNDDGGLRVGVTGGVANNLQIIADNQGRLYGRTEGGSWLPVRVNSSGQLELAQNVVIDNVTVNVGAEVKVNNDESEPVPVQLSGTVAYKWEREYTGQSGVAVDWVWGANQTQGSGSDFTPFNVENKSVARLKYSNKTDKTRRLILHQLMENTTSPPGVASGNYVADIAMRVKTISVPAGTTIYLSPLSLNHTEGEEVLDLICKGFACRFIWETNTDVTTGSEIMILAIR